MPFWFIPAAFAAKWAFARFTQHGGDPDATWDALQKDASAALAASLNFAKKGSDITVDTAKIVSAMVALRNAADFQSLVDGAHALSRALEHLPEETRIGLSKPKSFNLDAKINAALSTNLFRCGAQILEKAPHPDAPGEQVLQSLYFGLYLIGRSGETADADNASSCITNLINLHKAVNSANNEIVEALQAVTTGDITSLLNIAPGHMNLSEYVPTELQNTIGMYVISALGGEISPKERPLLQDLLLFSESA